MKPALLRALLIALLVCVQVVTVFIVMIGTRDKATDRLVESSHENLEELAGVVADEIGEFLAPSRVAINVTEQIVADSELNPDNSEALVRYFLAQLGASPTIHSMVFGRADGTYVGVKRLPGIFQSRTIRYGSEGKTVRVDQYSPELKYLRGWFDNEDEFDPRSRPWYRLGHRSSGLAWTDAYVFQSSGNPGITAAQTLKQTGGKEFGVLGVDVDITALSDFIAKIPATQKGTAAMIDRGGNVIAFSDLARLKQVTDQTRLASLDEVGELPIRRLYRSHLDGVADRGSQLADQDIQAAPQKVPTVPLQQFLRFSHEGQDYIGVVRSVSVFGDRLNWKLIAQTPVAGVVTQIKDLFEDQILTLVLVVVIPGLISVMAIFGLTEPIYRLHRDATIDKLTGVLNRTEFERRLMGMSRHRRDQESTHHVALVALDLDGFKAVNDRFGHGAGDAVLQQFASRLRDTLRQDDLLGRMGGDEFMLAIRLEERGNIAMVVDRLRQAATEAPFRFQAGQQKVGATAGVAWLEAWLKPSEVIASADNALVNGKARGKNRSYIASEDGSIWPADDALAVEASSLPASEAMLAKS
ncbi:MAG: diguanylate cyclase [Burkholderiaceae bacterium]